MSVKIDVQNINRKLQELSAKMGKEIKEKTIFRKAGKVVKDTMKQEVPVDTGRLRDSIDFLNFRKDKESLYVGARYNSSVDENGQTTKPTGRHAHLVEFGFIDKSGKRVEGNPFVKRTYNKTKDVVKANLIKEIDRLEKRIERQLSV